MPTTIQRHIKEFSPLTIFSNRLGDPWEKLAKNRLRIEVASTILKYKASRCRSLKEHVNVCFDVFNTFPLRLFGWSLLPLQVKEEMISLLEVIALQKPKNILEVGTAMGGTLYLFTRVADPVALIISIDLPGEKTGGGYPEWRELYYRSFASSQQKIRLIRGDSHSPETLYAVTKLLNGHELDFLFIDGDHTYGGVRTDFEMYAPMVRKGGLVAFHDICYHPPETGCEVHKLWNETKNRYKHEEIVKNLHQGWAGIGVLYI